MAQRAARVGLGRGVGTEGLAGRLHILVRRELLEERRHVVDHPPWVVRGPRL
jgi:hypothetical protein